MSGLIVIALVAVGILASAGATTPVGAPDTNAHLSTAGAVVTEAHPVHASSTQVDVSQNHRRLDIAVRMFTDDLEEGLARAGYSVSVHRSPQFAVDSALSAYLGRRLLIGIDGGPLTRARITQYRQDEDATLVFLQFDMRATPGRITIEQRVMLDQFDDQTNLVHVRFDTMRRSALLRRGSERADFEFR